MSSHPCTHAHLRFNNRPKYVYKSCLLEILIQSAPISTYALLIVIHAVFKIYSHLQELWGRIFSLIVALPSTLLSENVV